MDDPETYEKKLSPQTLGPGVRRALYVGVAVLALGVVVIGIWGMVIALSH
jgi:hypothetical protein